jgi:hypothetical protein
MTSGAHRVPAWLPGITACSAMGAEHGCVALLRPAIASMARTRRFACQDDRAAQFNLGMATTILVPNAAGDRRIRLPTDALSRGGWGGRYRGGRGTCHTRRRDDFSNSPVVRVDQQDLIVVELGILEVFGGRNLTGDTGRQLTHRHGLWYRCTDPGQESRRGGLTPFGLDALQDGLLLLGCQIGLCRCGNSNTSEKRGCNSATISILTHDVSPGLPSARRKA